MLGSKRRLRWGAGVMVIAAAAVSAASLVAFSVQAAQDGGNFLVENISSPSGKAVPIKVKLPAEVLQPNASAPGPVFLMFRGLPPEITFSAGFRVRDAWVVSLHDVPTLSMSSPPGYDGTFTLQVTLRKGQEVSPETRVISVDLGSETARRDRSRATVQTSTNAAPPVQPTVVVNVKQGVNTAPPPAPKTETVNKDEEAALLERAAEMLKHGDFEAARLIYTELADRGSSQAALHLAQTFDPQVMKDYFVIGLKPDLDKARRWYRKAADLGDHEAADRLSALELGK